MYQRFREFVLSGATLRRASAVLLAAAIVSVSAGCSQPEPAVSTAPAEGKLEVSAVASSPSDLAPTTPPIEADPPELIAPTQAEAAPIAPTSGAEIPSAAIPSAEMAEEYEVRVDVPPPPAEGASGGLGKSARQFDKRVERKSAADEPSFAAKMARDGSAAPMGISATGPGGGGGIGGLGRSGAGVGTTTGRGSLGRDSEFRGRSGIPGPGIGSGPQPRPANPPRMGDGLPSQDRAQSGLGAAQGGDEHKDWGVNLWTYAAQDALSTFAVDVDTASYTFGRRMLRSESRPDPKSVRVEEWVNYFRYHYAAPQSDTFAVHLEAAPSPFEPKLTLLRVGLKARELDEAARKPIHLTFLVDVSGSMNRSDRLPLAQRSLRLLVDNLRADDTVALCTYAGGVREVLRPTPAAQRNRIHAAIEELRAGGSTAMGSGLQLAYQLAWDSRQPGEESRVIVLSDGDANVGRTDHGDMLASVAHFAKGGITLSTIGFGQGNYKDNRMEQLANKGNGNSYYIDSFDEARRIFGQQIAGTLHVVAKDVKIQVEFDSDAVNKYRLVGYENRDLADRDFRNDKVDAGEVGSGHEVTALYEVEVKDWSRPWAIARLRWKAPQEDVATERAFPLDPASAAEKFTGATPSMRRAVAVAALAENLRNSAFRESWTLSHGEAIAKGALDREQPDELELLEMYRLVMGPLAQQ